MTKILDEYEASQLDNKSKQQWEKNADLRAEFTSLKAYQAYQRAVAEGRVKVHAAAAR